MQRRGVSFSRMRRTTITPEALLIPLFALLATFALSMTPWGSTFATIPGYSKEEKTAAVRLSGFLKPKVTMGIAESEKGVWVRVGLEGTEGTEGTDGTEVTISVPTSWHLEEVRGVHVRDIAREESGGQMHLVIPGRCPAFAEATAGRQVSGVRCQVELLFVTETPFDSLRFSHDSASPSLLKLTRMHFPEGEPEQILKFVKDTVTILL